MSHLRRDNSREERTMAVFDSVIELMMLMPDSICAGPQASLVCVCASRERQATEVRHYHAVPVDLTQPARPSCTMTNRFANLRALRVRLSRVRRPVGCTTRTAPWPRRADQSSIVLMLNRARGIGRDRQRSYRYVSESCVWIFERGAGRRGG